MQAIPDGFVGTFICLFRLINFLVKFHVRKIAFYSRDYVGSLTQEYAQFIDDLEDDMRDDVGTEVRVEATSTQEPVLIENIPDIKKED